MAGAGSAAASCGSGGGFGGLRGAAAVGAGGGGGAFAEGGPPRSADTPGWRAGRGRRARCSTRRARRDWLLINQGRRVWIRCRWSNQWLEPEIIRADFDAMIATPDRAIYPSVEQGLIALGLDAVFTGSYLP
ncbi:hypothetical protein [Streptomyces sp. NPDC056244]|uniref:hypothetical protein n=1 Tax=Streptomyces sp. NPDC056244 TaxID=3345762 RepID=UPI0035DFA8EF